MVCLDESATNEFVRGSLFDRFTVEAHLLACETCRELVRVARRALSSASANEQHSPCESADNLRSDERLTPGTFVGRYRIIGLAGSGAMGAVFEAHDPALDRPVAIKVLAGGGEQPRRRARLAREAKVLARLTHPNVAAVYDTGEHDGRLYIALEYVEGRTIRQWLAEAPQPPSEILRVFLDAGAGLAAAHEAGVVHRDFKPDNVLVSFCGRVLVVDFGLAFASDDRGNDAEAVPVRDDNARAQSPFRLTDNSSRLGTPAYMAPEQTKGSVADARSDQFSFCLALLESLRGARGGRAAKAVPLGVENAIVRGLATAASDRYPSMRDLLEAIRHQLSETKSRVIRRWQVAALGFFAMTIAGGIAWGKHRAAVDHAIGDEPTKWRSADLPLSLARVEVGTRVSVLLDRGRATSDLPGTFWVAGASDWPDLRLAADHKVHGIDRLGQVKAIDGFSMTELIAHSWSWQLELPFEDPVLDGQCATGRIGDTLILPRADGTTVLACKIASRATDTLFVPWAGSECSTIPSDHAVHDVEFGTSPSELTRCALAWDALSPVVQSTIAIDGHSVSIEPHYVTTPMFGFDLAANNTFHAAGGTYWAVAHGFGFAIRPLPVGIHELRFFVKQRDGHVKNQRFTLNVTREMPIACSRNFGCRWGPGGGRRNFGARS